MCDLSGFFVVTELDDSVLERDFDYVVEGGFGFLWCCFFATGRWSQVSLGSVPSMKAASYESGQVELETRFVALSRFTRTTPDGGVNGFVSLYWGKATAFFMNAAQMGAAECAPSKPRSL